LPEFIDHKNRSIRVNTRVWWHAVGSFVPPTRRNQFSDEFRYYEELHGNDDRRRHRPSLPILSLPKIICAWTGHGWHRRPLLRRTHAGAPSDIWCT